MRKAIIRYLTGMITTAAFVLTVGFYYSGLIGCGAVAATTTTTTTTGAVTLTGTIAGSGSSGLTQAFTSADGTDIAKIIALFTDATTAIGEVSDEGVFSISITEETLASTTSLVLTALNSAGVFVKAMILGDGTGVLTLSGITGSLNLGTFTCSSSGCTSDRTLDEILADLEAGDYDVEDVDCSLFGAKAKCDGGCDFGEDFDPNAFNRDFEDTLQVIDCTTPNGSRLDAEGNVQISGNSQLIIRFSRPLNANTIKNGVSVTKDGVSISTYSTATLDSHSIQITPTGSWGGEISIAFKAALTDEGGTSYDGSDTCDYTVPTTTTAGAFKLAGMGEVEECNFKGGFGNCPEAKLDADDPNHDSDCDCWSDSEDNCPDDPNPDQIPFCVQEFRDACDDVGQFDPFLCGCFGESGSLNTNLPDDLEACCQKVCDHVKPPPAECHFGGFGGEVGGGATQGGGFCNTNDDCRWMGEGSICTTVNGFKDCQPASVTACSCDFFGGPGSPVTQTNCDADLECQGGFCMQLQGWCDPCWIGGTFATACGGQFGGGAPPPVFQPGGGGGDFVAKCLANIGSDAATVPNHCEFFGPPCTTSADCMNNFLPGAVCAQVFDFAPAQKNCVLACTTGADCD